MRRPRRRSVAFATLAVSLVIASQRAFAGSTADEPPPTRPTGIGSLLPLPENVNKDVKPTLFERYPATAYILDTDLGWKDALDAAFARTADMLMYYIVAIVRGAISIGWYLFSFTKVGDISEATSDIMAKSGQATIEWVLPSAMVVGAVIAYMHRRGQGTAMSQLIWVFAAAVISVSLAVSPSMWVGGVDAARQAGAKVVMDATSASVSGNYKKPIEWEETAPTGRPGDDLLRKSADATWRAFALTPWCVAEFGSLEACERYGKEILNREGDRDARKDYINGDMSKAEKSGDAPTITWTKGKESTGRIGVLIFAAIAATLFAFLTVALAFTALMAFIGCLLLLTVGVFFACLWVIPGKPRQWGMNWFEALLGMVLQSILAMLVFGVTLSLVTAVFSLTGELGWLPVSGLAIAVLIAAFQLRRVLNSLMAMMRPGTGSMLVGRGARNLTRMVVSSVLSRFGGRGGTPQPRSPEDIRGRRQAGHADTRPIAIPYRKAPSPGRGRRVADTAPSPNGDVPVGARAALSRGHEPGQADEARQRPALTTGSSGTSAAPNGRPRPTAGGPGPAARGRTFSVTQAGVVNREDGKRISKSRHGATVAVPTPSSRQQVAARQRRQGPVRAPDGRYEPRRFSYSASLREGPPKATRERRRPTVRPREYREYTKVVKDGVTLHVPKSR